jgi:hypothetical protein
MVPAMMLAGGYRARSILTGCSWLFWRCEGSTRGGGERHQKYRSENVFHFDHSSSLLILTKLNPSGRGVATVVPSQARWFVMAVSAIA